MASDKDNVKKVLVAVSLLFVLSIITGFVGYRLPYHDVKIGGFVMAAVFFGLLCYFGWRYKGASTDDNNTNNNKRTVYRCEYCSARYDLYSTCAAHEGVCPSNLAVQSQERPVGGYYQNQPQYAQQPMHDNSLPYAQPVHDNQPQYAQQAMYQPPSHGNVVVGVPVTNSRQ
eukprot:GEMP01053318.1.p2 GENE.GEMP01053318.1~~GEMP01053318.1.p2  ORF type:complete len:171 (-),score=41.97 GEMP01053318.1:929-1441(-)